jgi:hypothetical protein
MLGRGRQLTPLCGGALAQERYESLLGHRLAEQETLAEIAAQADERDRVGGLFDAHGDCLAPETMGEIDHGLAERRVGLVDAAIDDEGASELQFGERKFIDLSAAG